MLVVQKYSYFCTIGDASQIAHFRKVFILYTRKVFLKLSYKNKKEKKVPYMDTLDTLNTLDTLDTIVMKFGGSSVADNDKLRLVADKIIELYNKQNNIVVVVSAQR